jgi:hypothetical protein
MDRPSKYDKPPKDWAAFYARIKAWDDIAAKLKARREAEPCPGDDAKAWARLLGVDLPATKE